MRLAVDNLSLERDFPAVDPREIKKVINQSGFQLQIAADGQRVSPDGCGDLGISIDSGKYGKDRRKGVRSSWLKIARN
jgi:hypothetical protein